MKLMNHLMFIAISCFVMQSSAQAFVRANAVPGGVVKIAVEGDPARKPKAYFAKHRVMLIKNVSDPSKPWQAIIGIPLKAKHGQHQLRVEHHDGKKIQIPFTVKNKIYKQQYIWFKKKKKKKLIHKPNPKLEKRLRDERTMIQTALSTYNEAHTPKKFRAPLNGRISSRFGLRRFYNKVPKHPHAGLDVAAPTGRHIRAPAAGKVVLAHHLVYTGKTVFLDHGHGFITLYAHMRKIKVKNGQRVKAGDVLGTVGMTGRTNGPHLHWGAILNHARINPELLVHERVITKKK